MHKSQPCEPKPNIRLHQYREQAPAENPEEGGCNKDCANCPCKQGDSAAAQQGQPFTEGNANGVC